MKIEAIVKHLESLKVEDADTQKKIDLILDGAKAAQKTDETQFSELKKSKEVIGEIRKTFELEENTPVSEISAKAKAKLDDVVKEKDSLGQSADDQTKTLTAIKKEFDELRGEFNKSQEIIKQKDADIADKNLSDQIRKAYKGDTDLYEFAEPKIKKLLEGKESSEIQGTVESFLKDNVKFQLSEQNPGPGGEEGGAGGNPEPTDMLSIMESVSEQNKG